MENVIIINSVKKEDVEKNLDTISQKIYKKAKWTDLDYQKQYRAIAFLVNKMAELRKDEIKNENYTDEKQVLYMSIEFLLGRAIKNNLENLGLLKPIKEICEESEVDFEPIVELEDDIGTGNGGLGRLAACYIASAATKKINAQGVGIYYKKGLFKQAFDENGCQIELPDEWEKFADCWFKPIQERAQIVTFQDTAIKAVPYVMDTFGYTGNEEKYDGNIVPLVLWKAEPIPGVTNKRATKISDVLYPEDQTLRLYQEYFFVSAQLQDTMERHMKKYGTLDNFADKHVIQLNDTHPISAIPEFIMIAEKKYGYKCKDAFEIAKKTFNYTNHTIMPEALETWDITLYKNLLPSVFQVIEDMNQVLIDMVRNIPRFNYNNRVGNPNWPLINEYELFDHKGKIHMSRIGCFVCNKINGVAEVHSEILKTNTLKKWYELFPEKFTNVTNGVTPRRWIALANPELEKFLNKWIGKGWLNDLSKIKELEKYKDDEVVLGEFAKVKDSCKKTLANYIEQHEGKEIDTNSIFLCQVKRFHEYKRQLMNALRILYLYREIKYNGLKVYPMTFIIGGKAASGYKMAKMIIQLLNDISDMIAKDPEVNQMLNVVVVTNFNVSYGELIYPAADVSEQISTVGTEASGTGNMKFMMNGAPTLGTFDGANIEIVEQSGDENNFIFGEKIDQFIKTTNFYGHDNHNYTKFLNDNSDILSLLDYLKGGSVLKNSYWDIVNTMLYNDRYYVMYDLKPYIEATIRLNKIYASEKINGGYEYTKKGLMNTANSGYFSSDRSIMDYDNNVWNTKPIKRVK